MVDVDARPGSWSGATARRCRFWCTASRELCHYRLEPAIGYCLSAGFPIKYAALREQVRALTGCPFPCSISAIFPSSPTSTTASRHWPTASSSYCGGLADREMEEQVLDSMDLERERGITIKAQTAALEYRRAGRQAVPAQPDRHARARRFFLRGVALALGLRGRAAGGGRLAGRGGADRGQLLHRHRAGRGSDPGAQQDGSAAGGARARDRARSRTSSAYPPRMRCG